MDFTHIDRKSKINWSKLIQYLQVLSGKETRVVHFCTLFSETGLSQKLKILPHFQLFCFASYNFPILAFLFCVDEFWSNMPISKWGLKWFFGPKVRCVSWTCFCHIPRQLNFLVKRHLFCFIKCLILHRWD